MDSRAKQRLTGAVILVALIVLLVPELLTGPREAHAPANADNGEGLREYTIDMDTQDRGAPARAAPPADTSVALPPVADPMNATPERAVPGEAATPEPAPAPTTNPMAPQVTPNNVAATPARPAPVAESTPRADPPKPAPNQSAERGTFVVQLASFRSKENADRLVRDMTAKGFAVFIAPTTSNGYELYRVRVGPTRTRASAEALAAELKRVGQPGSIVSIP
jgi:DedD protein